MDPLDVNALRGLQRPRHDLQVVRERIEAHLDAHDGYVAFSGGKDSLVVLHQALAVDPEVPVVFFDSGLEFPETYAYLEQLTHQWRLQLDVIPAERNALEVLAASGRWDHHGGETVGRGGDLHEVLIAGPARRAHASWGPGELWGLRSAEARGRRIAHQRALNLIECDCCSPAERRRRHGGCIERVDGTVAYSPVWDWSTADVWAHIGRHQLPVNPVYERLRRLGAPEQLQRVSPMVDASLLEQGRMVWLQRGWPALFNDLARVLPRLTEFV